MKEKIIDHLKHHKETSFKIMIVVILVLAAVYFTFDHSEEEEIIIEKSPEMEIEEASTFKEVETESFIWVDVSGQVANPGVLKLKSETRVYEAIKRSGGLLKDADTSMINMAAKLRDEDKLYIPKIGETQRTHVSQTVGYQGSNSQNSNGLININTASSEQLQQLSGVGPSTAEKIITYRSTSGQFETIDDIKNVSGIGDKTFAKFKEKICI